MLILLSNYWIFTVCLQHNCQFLGLCIILYHIVTQNTILNKLNQFISGDSYHSGCEVGGERLGRGRTLNFVCCMGWP